MVTSTVVENIAPITDDVPELTVEEKAAERVRKAREKEEEKALKERIAEETKKNKELEKEIERNEKEKQKSAERTAKDEEKKDAIKKVREQDEEVFKDIVDSVKKDKNYKDLVSNCYQLADAAADCVLEGISTGALIESKGGLGKSHRYSKRTYAKLDTEEIGELNSFTTPSAFYIWLFKNKDKGVLLLDDLSGLFTNEKSMNMLKAATWGVGATDKRVISYLTTKPLKDEFEDLVPSNFVFNARLIILANDLNKDNPHVKAILTRINYVYLDIPRDELLRIAQQIVAQEHKGLTFEERKECLKFLELNTDNNTDDLNFRTLKKVMDFRVLTKRHNTGDLWKVLSLSVLDKDEKIVLMEKMLWDDTFSTEEERMNKWCELTNLKRAQYFRVKKATLKQWEKAGIIPEYEKFVKALEEKNKVNEQK